jgi:hypothetical protein
LQNYFEFEETAEREVNGGSSWCRSVRVAIIDHLVTLDINIPLLMEIVESYRYEEIEELVEIVRSLDILGAERRLSEYEALLYMALREIEPNERCWERIYGERLPVSFFDHVKKFDFSDSSEKILGTVGSNLSVAQWLYELGGINFHAEDDAAFQSACRSGHLDVARWLYELGGVNIHIHNDLVFRGACGNGHISVAQ